MSKQVILLKTVQEIGFSSITVTTNYGGMD